MGRSPADNRRWMDAGTALFSRALADLADDAWDAPTALPGWTCRTVVAHVAANAAAVGNLIRWAATGTVSPMYPSPTDRADGIALGERLEPAELTDWFLRSAEQLRHAVAALAEERWQHPVVTAQGRHVPASEAPWMRAREVMVHAVDLATGVTFASLPADFLSALRTDIELKRGGASGVVGPEPEVLAYLSGRPHRGVNAQTGGLAPTLAPWL